MHIKIICDIRENFDENIINNDINFSDHPPKDNIYEIQKFIEECGFKCSIFGGIPELIKAVENKITVKDTIFLNLTDGLEMSCGRVQAPILLEILGADYSGANPFQAALIDNKFYTKLAVKNINILVPDSILVHTNDKISSDSIQHLTFPLLIKPNTKGSSIGITQENICYNFETLNQYLAKMKKDFDELLIEQFIPGYEVTNFIIGNDGDYIINEPVLEEFHGNMIHKSEVMAVEDKAYRTRTFHLCNQILGENTTKKIKVTSSQIKEELQVNDILRIDYRITEQGDIYFLEANTVPRICSKNEAGFICKSYQKPHNYLINCLIDTVIKRCIRDRGL